MRALRFAPSLLLLWTGCSLVAPDDFTFADAAAAGAGGMVGAGGGSNVGPGGTSNGLAGSKGGGAGSGGGGAGQGAMAGTGQAGAGHAGAGQGGAGHAGTGQGGAGHAGTGQAGGGQSGQGGAGQAGAGNAGGGQAGSSQAGEVDFTLPPSVLAAAGQTANVQFPVTTSANVSGTISFTVTGAPTGVTASVADVTVGGTSLMATLTLVVPASEAAGETAPLVITAHATGAPPQAHSTTLTIAGASGSSDPTYLPAVHSRARRSTCERARCRAMARCSWSET